MPAALLALAGVAAAAGVAIDRHLLLTKDVRELLSMATVLKTGRQLMQHNTLIPDVFHDAVVQWPQHACLAFEDRKLTFQQVDEISNRVAHWALRQGLQPGDKVALLMDNRPEYVVVWLGLLKVGVVAALINTHLMADGMLHCIKIAAPKLAIVGVELLSKFASVASELHGVGVHVYGDDVSPWKADRLKYPFAQSLDDQLEATSAQAVPQDYRENANITPTDTAMLIYTSGTTGLPKAARVNHYLILMRSLGMRNVMGLTPQDRIYCPLPLYHTSGGNLAVGMCFYSGATLCISKRFSSSRFWTEVRQFDATIIQYIGEMCRYLVNAPPQVDDADNNVRAAFGNGLRPDVWHEFQDRFQIPMVQEFYGSTEGNVSFANTCTELEHRGHLGQRGTLMKALLGAKIVRFDVEKDEHVRGKNGFMEECDYDEVGELIGKIADDNPARKFSGYYGNEKESSRKILRDVFVKGDAYFRTGDLFKIDCQRRWHFMDRVGDTFRWKGENVATNEVAQAISKFPGLSDLCVYGVEVPGHEGRACLAAMVFEEDNFDLKAFAQHVTAKLPSYAVPLFLRQLGAMSVTGTMKYEKAKLRKEGMDPTQVSDKLWFYSKEKNTYERLTVENFHSVVTESRL